VKVKAAGIFEGVDGFVKIKQGELVLAIIIAPLVASTGSRRIDVAPLAVERTTPVEDGALAAAGVMATLTILRFLKS
jgi:hypothetical protein